MNHIRGTSTPPTWVISGRSPDSAATRSGLALQVSQCPTWARIDGLEMADHGGLEA